MTSVLLYNCKLVKLNFKPQHYFFSTQLLVSRVAHYTSFFFYENKVQRTLQQGKYDWEKDWNVCEQVFSHQ
jgi:hypothetical protein